MDIIFIRELTVETIIGIYDWEREIRQVISIDLEMAADNTRPAATESKYRRLTREIATVACAGDGVPESIGHRDSPSQPGLSKGAAMGRFVVGLATNQGGA